MPFEIEAAESIRGPVAQSGVVREGVGYNGALNAPAAGPRCGQSPPAGPAGLTLRAAVVEVDLGDRVAAYLVDPSAVDGAGVLFSQKRSVDSCAARLGLSVSRYYCDSGRPDDAPVGRHHLERLLGDAGAGAFAVVIVAAEARFGDPAGTSTEARLARLGIEVRDAAGARLGRRASGACAAAAAGRP